MPRQPLKFQISIPEQPALRFGIRSHTSKPEITQQIGSCLLMWSYVEAEMGIVLGALLNAENEAALAVFQVLRRSSAQREAISEAAKVSAPSECLEPLNALLNVHKSIEAERNSLAHGIFGVCDKINDGVVWLPSNDQVLLRLKLHTDKDADIKGDLYNEIADKAFVYRSTDIEQILDDIRWLWGAWFDFTKILLFPGLRAEALRRLCGQSRIAQEIERLRQKNNPSTQPQSTPPKTGAS